MSDRKQHRLELLRRLREMGVERARADHVAAQSELEKRTALCEETQQRIAALEGWTQAQLAGSTPINCETLRQAQLFRGAERQVLERQRAEERQSAEHTEAARLELGARFEELSVAEKLAERNAGALNLKSVRASYVELDEAGARRKNLDAKE